jgi:hypothetical protein
LPYARRWPYTLHRGDQALLTLTDLSAATNRIQVTFKGFQLIPAE